jgi:hypothetical protein
MLVANHFDDVKSIKTALKVESLLFNESFHRFNSRSMHYHRFIMVYRKIMFINYIEIYNPGKDCSRINLVGKGRILVFSQLKKWHCK